MTAAHKKLYVKAIHLIYCTKASGENEINKMDGNDLRGEKCKQKRLILIVAESYEFILLFLSIF